MFRRPGDLPDDLKDSAGRPAFPVLIATLLGLAAAMTAFAAYQAELNDGDSIKSFNEGIRLGDKANQAFTAANQQLVEDRTLFIEYARTLNRGDKQQAKLIKEGLMGPDLLAQLKWWEEQNPRPASPFFEENPAYRSAGLGQGYEQDRQAADKFEQAKDFDDTGDRYTLITVFLATALFLWGIAGVTPRYKVRLGTLGMGAVVFVASCAMLIAV